MCLCVYTVSFSNCWHSINDRPLLAFSFACYFFFLLRPLAHSPIAMYGPPFDAKLFIKGTTKKKMINIFSRFISVQLCAFIGAIGVVSIESANFYLAPAPPFAARVSLSIHFQWCLENLYAFVICMCAPLLCYVFLATIP